MKKKHGGMLSDAGQTRLASATANGIYIEKFNTCSRRVNGRDWIGSKNPSPQIENLQ